MSFAFENLEVYKRSLTFVETIDNLLAKCGPKLTRMLQDQLHRASVSIPLNIAEGNGRWHNPDKRNFFWIARGSVFECIPLIELLLRKRLISETESKEFREQLTIIGKMLTNLVKAHGGFKVSAKIDGEKNG